MAVRSVELDGKSVNVVLVADLPEGVQEILASGGSAVRWCVIPDDQEVVPLLAVIARAYLEVSKATETERKRVLGDRERAAKRLELVQAFVARIAGAAAAVAELAAFDSVRPALKLLAELPQEVRPALPDLAARRRGGRGDERTGAAQEEAA